MTGRRCCDAGEPPRRATAGALTGARRCFGVAEWVAPAAVLALLPKCPMCLAAYVAVITGIGLSAPVATYLRTGLLLGCVALLAFLLVRRAYRAFAS